MEKNQKVIYRENQRPRQIWLWVLVLLIVSFFWYSFIQQIFYGVPIGSNPAPDMVLIILWLIFGIMFPVMMIGFLKLIIEVRIDGVYIRFVPFHLHYRKFLYKDIEHFGPIDYSIFEFGGWGIRVNSKGETAYSMNGKQGIRLNLKNETVVIGTQKQIEIINAINSLKGRH